MIERLNQEFKRRGRVVRIFPNAASCIRLYGSIAKEFDEDWSSGKRYMDMSSLWMLDSKAPEQEEDPLPALIQEKNNNLCVV